MDKNVEEDVVFSCPFGGLMDPSELSRQFKSLAEKAGYPGVRLHDLCHGHCAGLTKAGVHDTVAQQRLGHSPAGLCT